MNFTIDPQYYYIHKRVNHPYYKISDSFIIHYFSKQNTSCENVTTIQVYETVIKTNVYHNNTCKQRKNKIIKTLITM